MQIHTKVRYGLRAVIEIAKKQNTNKGVLQKEIAEEQNIPIYYLDSIIKGLKSTGIISDFKGKSSGYKLNKKPEDILVYDIYRSFEEDICLVKCKNQFSRCERIEICEFTDYWTELSEILKNEMKKTTIKQFL